MTLATKATRGAVAGNAWTNPGNATVDDGTNYATAAPAKNGNVAGDWDFAAFSDAELPVGATINSVTLRIQYKVSTQASVFDLTLTRKNGGVSDGTTNDATEPLADTNLDSAFSSVPTEAQLKTAGQVSVGANAHRGNSNTAVTASIDYIELRVDYSPPPILLVGSSAGTSTAAGALTTSIALAGSSAGTSTAAGVLTVPAAALLAGSSAGASSAAAALSTTIALAGSAAASSSAAGALTTQVRLAGAAAGAATAAGALTAGSSAALFAGSAAGQASAAGALTTVVRLAASVSGAGAAAAQLSTQIALVGSAIGAATAQGALTAEAVLVVGGTPPHVGYARVIGPR